jgi:hypothetical protein
MAFGSLADVATFAANTESMLEELALSMGTAPGSIEATVVYKISLEYSFSGAVTEDDCRASVAESDPLIDLEDVTCTVELGESSGTEDDANATTTAAADDANATTTAAAVTVTSVVTTTEGSRRLSSHGAGSRAIVVINVNDADNVGALAEAAGAVTAIGDVGVEASAPTFAAEVTFQVSSDEAVVAPTAATLEGAVARGAGVTVEASEPATVEDSEEEEPNRGEADGGAASTVLLSQTLAAALIALGVSKL